MNGQLTFLREQGFDISVIAAPSESLDIVREREQVQTIPIPIEREISPMADVRTLAKLCGILRTLRPDIFGSVDDFLNQAYPRGLEDIRKAPNLTQGMLDRGYSDQTIKQVLGASWLRAMQTNIG